MKQCTICGYIKPITRLKRHRICDDCFFNGKWNNGKTRHDKLEDVNWYSDRLLNAFSHGYIYLDDYYRDRQ
jgi:hypothetical protein